jgi:ribosomal protein S4
MNLALSLMQAKQFIRHGFVFVNGRKVVYRNYKVKPNDIISLDRQMFLNFLLNNKKLPLNFMFSSVVKPELPHLYVKHRLLTGIFLYDPLNNYNVLSKQNPSFFFGKSKVKYEHMNFHKISENSRSFKEYKEKKKFFEKRNKTNPFIAKYHEIFENENNNIPLNNVKLVLSYFLKN